jgi:hypothetical protein
MPFLPRLAGDLLAAFAGRLGIALNSLVQMVLAEQRH